MESYVDMIKDGKIAVFFPFTGSKTFRTADLKNIIHYSPSYSESTGTAVTYILNNHVTKKWALIYQNDLFGKVLKTSIQELLNQKGIKEILDVPYERNDVNFTRQTKDVAAFAPDVIGLLGPAISAQGYMRAAGTKDLANKIMFGLSWLSGGKLQTFLDERGLKIIIPTVLPDPKTSEIPIAKKFRKMAEEANIPVDVNAFEGYLDVRLFAHLLQQIKGTITVEKIMQAAEQIKDYDFEGLKLNFDPKTLFFLTYMVELG